jgi:hypothetical protein
MLTLIERQSHVIYFDIWVGPLIGMTTDTVVTCTQHLDAMKAHFVALNNVPFKTIIRETHAQAQNVPIHVVFDFAEIANERIQTMFTLLIELTTAENADRRLAQVKERVDYLKVCIDLSNEEVDDLHYSNKLAIHRSDRIQRMRLNPTGTIIDTEAEEAVNRLDQRQTKRHNNQPKKCQT